MEITALCAAIIAIVMCFVLMAVIAGVQKNIDRLLVVVQDILNIQAKQVRNPS